MPRFFNKAELDELRSLRTAGKSHTCEKCSDPECEGTCAKGDKKDGASVLDALESRVAALCSRCKGQGCMDCKGTGQVPDEQMPQRSEWFPEQVSPQPPPSEPPTAQRMARRWSVFSEVSMPPEGVIPQHETALPYNPAAYEGQVEDMHPAAQYAYQRAVANGAQPQEAMATAQEKQGEMMRRTQEGQNVEGVQIPVVNT